ncbi:MAG: P-II family nitrogen regulator [Planctomycetes bacterium]|nr:P-II family nitrogen regulator [Planctomycetota bacterium]
MRRLSCIVKPFKRDAVAAALARAGASGVVVSEVRGYGRQKGHLELYDGSEYDITFLPKVKVEAVLDDAAVEAAIGAVIQAARTGRIGDGKVFVQRVGTGDP